MVRTPRGIEEIDNALFQYRFHPIPGSPSSPDHAFEIGAFTDLPTTVRAIDDDGNVQLEKANALLQKEGKCVMPNHLSTMTALTFQQFHAINAQASDQTQRQLSSFC
jgi:hypothetical protein